MILFNFLFNLIDVISFIHFLSLTTRLSKAGFVWWFHIIFVIFYRFYFPFLLLFLISDLFISLPRRPSLRRSRPATWLYVISDMILFYCIIYLFPYPNDHLSDDGVMHDDLFWFLISSCLILFLLYLFTYIFFIYLFP
jgi:hypothetical protein